MVNTFCKMWFITVLLVCAQTATAGQIITVKIKSVAIGTGKIVYSKLGSLKSLQGTLGVLIPSDSDYETMDPEYIVSLYRNKTIIAACGFEKHHLTGRKAIYRLYLKQRKKLAVAEINGTCDINPEHEGEQVGLLPLEKGDQAIVFEDADPTDNDALPTDKPSDQTSSQPSNQPDNSAHSKPGPITLPQANTVDNVEQTLEEMAASSGKSLAELNQTHVGSYTDWLTPPQTKTECTHTHVGASAPECRLEDGGQNCDFLGICVPNLPRTVCTTKDIVLCDTYETSSREMQCDLNVNVPFNGNVIVSVARNAAKKFIDDAVDQIKMSIEAAILRATAHSFVVATGAAGATAATGFIPAFVTSMGLDLPSEMGIARSEITSKVMRNAESQLKKFDIPNIGLDNIQTACGWGNWHRL